MGIPSEMHCPGLSDDVVDVWRRTADLLEKVRRKSSRLWATGTDFAGFVFCVCVWIVAGSGRPAGERFAAAHAVLDRLLFGAERVRGTQ